MSINQVRYHYKGIITGAATSKALLIPEAQELTIVLDASIGATSIATLYISHDDPMTLIKGLGIGKAWIANTVYYNNQIILASGSYFLAQIGLVGGNGTYGGIMGTAKSGAIAPTWPGTEGQTVVDNSNITWINIGAANPAPPIVWEAWSNGSTTNAIKSQAFPADSTITAVRCVSTGSTAVTWTVNGDRYTSSPTGGIVFAEDAYSSGAFVSIGSPQMSQSMNAGIN